MATAFQAEHATEPCRWPIREELTEKLHAARRAAATARDTAEGVTADAVAKVRRHPLRALGAAMIGGAVIGSSAGLFAGFFMRPRRRRWEW